MASPSCPPEPFYRAREGPWRFNAAAETQSDIPSLFRLTLQVPDLAQAAQFYAKLLGTEGRDIRDSRHYFNCGPVILTILDPTAGGDAP